MVMWYLSEILVHVTVHRGVDDYDIKLTVYVEIFNTLAQDNSPIQHWGQWCNTTVSRYYLGLCSN